MKSFTQILEKQESEEFKSINATMFFSDVVGSSKLWTEYGDNMFDALVEHEKLVDKLIENKGYVVKTIGDAFMCVFEGQDSLLDAVEFAKELTEQMTIKVGGKGKMELRIGIAYGGMRKRKMKIQDNEVYDFFGNAVNAASRMESTVSAEGGFAFTMIDSIDNAEMKKLTTLVEQCKSMEIVDFENDCRKDSNEKVKRSGRLLTSMQRNKCENIDDLKGVKPLRAYKCKI